MQWIKTERNQLIPPLQMVSGIVERCHTMPILAHVMITKNGSELAFLATDLDVQITARADIGSGPESAATTVAARKLLDILRAVPAGEVQISVADQRLTIQAGKSRFGLHPFCDGAAGYPLLSACNVAGGRRRRLKRGGDRRPSSCLCFDRG